MESRDKFKIVNVRSIVFYKYETFFTSHNNKKSPQPQKNKKKNKTALLISAEYVCKINQIFFPQQLKGSLDAEALP